MRLVLWDIDGTLVESAGVGLKAFGDAFERLTGSPPERFPKFAGRTDPFIGKELLEIHGIEPEGELLSRFGPALHAALVEREGELKANGRAFPGAREAIELLATEDAVLQSLLTGNIAENAEVKLRPFGLDQLLDLAIGAYGSDTHGIRGELVAIARTRAEEKYGIRIAPPDVVLIGDTPLDIEAAHHGGARAIGVATGPYSTRELEAAGADAVFGDLTDAEALRSVVMAPV